MEKREHARRNDAGQKPSGRGERKEGKRYPMPQHPKGQDHARHKVPPVRPPTPRMTAVIVRRKGSRSQPFHLPRPRASSEDAAEDHPTHEWLGA
jgi:hypothetical protein